MSIFEPKVAGLYGALDSGAFADGEPNEAHTLTELAKSANRLLLKGHPMVCLPWTTDPEAELGFGAFSALGWFGWTQIHVPITCPKKPGLSTAQVRIKAKVLDSFKIDLQFVTRAQPLTQGSILSLPNVVTLAGDGSNDFATYILPELPLLQNGDHEVFTIFARGSRIGNLSDPEAGFPSFGDLDFAGLDFMTRTTIVDNDAIWTRSGLPSGNDLATRGHYIDFTDAPHPGGRSVISPRQITLVPNARTLHFEPELTFIELQTVMRSAGFYVLRKLIPFALSGITIAANGRVATPQALKNVIEGSTGINVIEGSTGNNVIVRC